MKSHLNSYATTISRDILNHQIKCLTKKLSPRIIGFIGLNKSFLNPFFKLIKVKNLHLWLRWIITKVHSFGNNIIETFLTECVSIRNHGRRWIPKKIQIIRFREKLYFVFKIVLT